MAPGLKRGMRKKVDRFSSKVAKSLQSLITTSFTGRVGYWSDCVTASSSVVLLLDAKSLFSEKCPGSRKTYKKYTVIPTVYINIYFIIYVQVYIFSTRLWVTEDLSGVLYVQKNVT